MGKGTRFTSQRGQLESQSLGWVQKVPWPLYSSLKPQKYWEQRASGWNCPARSTWGEAFREHSWSEKSAQGFFFLKEKKTAYEKIYFSEVTQENSGGLFALRCTPFPSGPGSSNKRQDYLVGKSLAEEPGKESPTYATDMANA